MVRMAILEEPEKMTEITTMNLFITQQERKRLKLRLLNLTEMLIITLNIDPYGRQLVIACGTGVEPNNKAAILAWLDKAICCEARLDVFKPDQIAKALERHLEHSIGRWCN